MRLILPRRYENFVNSNACIYYGISRPVMKNETNEIREGRFCKCCGERLQYSFYHYSQLGDYRCPKCGFNRPTPDFDAEDVKVGDQLSFSVENRRIVATPFLIIFFLSYFLVSNFHFRFGSFFWFLC